MELWQEIVISLFLVTAGLFGLVGSFGLIKLPSPITRLHAPTKATTLGVGGALVASMLHSVFTQGVVSFHEILITLFLLLTAPITAHFIAKIHLHQTIPRGELPPTGTGSPWASEPEQPEPARNKTDESA
jgi:multicomponent K+:H+ antiporter subunit G